jgi:plasmid stabilization system protein ParE
MRLRYSKRASGHISAVFDYIGEDNLQAAAMVIAHIRASAQALSYFPNIGHAGHLSGTLEHKVKRLPYVIVYRVELGNTDQIVILGVYHAHRHRGQ